MTIWRMNPRMRDKRLERIKEELDAIITRAPENAKGVADAQEAVQKAHEAIRALWAVR